MDYVKQFCAHSGNPLKGKREVLTDELWSGTQLRARLQPNTRSWH